MQQIVAATLVCLRDGLLNCADGKAVQDYVSEHAPALTVAQLRRVLENDFMASIRATVGAAAASESPELAPTS